MSEQNEPRAMSNPIVDRMADTCGLSVDSFRRTMQQMCGCQGATAENFYGLLIVAETYRLNPVLRQLYLMQTKKGVEVIIPIDGWVPLLTRHPDYLAHDVSLIWEGESFKSPCIGATCRIWTKSRQANGLPAFEHSELTKECVKDTGPWKSHPTRMIGHKAVMQATRRCFGVYVPDEDEARGYGEPTIRDVASPGFVLDEVIEPATVIEVTEQAEPIDVPPVQQSAPPPDQVPIQNRKVASQPRKSLLTEPGIDDALAALAKVRGPAQLAEFLDTAGVDYPAMTALDHETLLSRAADKQREFGNAG